MGNSAVLWDGGRELESEGGIGESSVGGMGNPPKPIGKSQLKGDRSSRTDSTGDKWEGSTHLGGLVSSSAGPVSKKGIVEPERMQVTQMVSGGKAFRGWGFLV